MSKDKNKKINISPEKLRKIHHAKESNTNDHHSTSIKKMILQGVLCVLACIAVLVYSLLPELSDFRTSIYGTILFILALAGVIAYVTFSSSISMPLLGKITVWAYLALYILLVIVDLGKIEALFFFIYSVINVIVSVYIYLKYGKEYKSIWAFGAFAYLSTAFLGIRAELINDNWWITIVIPSIVVGVMALLLCIIYFSCSDKAGRNRENRFAAPLLGLVFGFLITFLTISSMNVYLDTSTPAYEEFVIVNKWVSTGAKRPTAYKFDVKNRDRALTVTVLEESYYDYEINDTIVLSIYNGAFNEPYYIHESNAD